MKKKPRPTSITVIAWFLIVGGVISQIPCLIRLHIHVRPYATMIFNIVCAIAMLKGRNWGRFVYAIGGTITFVINLATFPAPINAIHISALVIFIIMMIFLFRPRANEYFTVDKATSHIFVRAPKDITQTTINSINNSNVQNEVAGWICTKCKEKIESQFTACWSCGTARDESQ